MSRYRAGPWPGLTPRGAGILLACAAFLAMGQLLVGAPTRPLPDLAVVGATALLPMVVGTRIVRTIGAASAVCGVYLLPASTVTLLLPSIPPPPLLLVSAIVFDVSLWLELVDLWPRRREGRRTGFAHAPTNHPRSAVAGAAFGLVLALVEPPFRVFLGADPSVWLGPARWLALIATTLVCAGVATLLTVRGTAA